MGSNVWRNFINKPKLSNYINNVAEIGFSHYGPTFSIAGTLGASNSVVLVYNICAEITSRTSKLSHFMDWFAFRPATYVMGNFSGMDLEMASKFTVAPDHSHEHNTLFIDNNRYSEMKPVLTAIKDTWEESLITASKEGRTVDLESLFAEFKELKIITTAAERLKGMNYWEPGDYHARVRFTTENPKQIFNADLEFFLKEEDTEMLSGNGAAIIANICQQPQVSYSCLTPILTVAKQ